MSIHVTEHAVDRYIERISPVSRGEARATIIAAERTMEFAVSFGAHVVKLRSGGKAVLRGVHPIRVVTVVGTNAIPDVRSELRTTCCGLCGLQCSHPIASACTRPDCALGARRRSVTDHQGGRS